MNISNEKYEVNSNTDGDSKRFEIEGNVEAFNILSQKIYSDVPRAIIRELSCNAIDANTDANVDDPFEISLPTKKNPILSIIDHGIGMTHEDVQTVYTSYFKSTKSKSNQSIGAYGLGGKTPFAYTDQFVLETAKDGKKNFYIVYKDEFGIPSINLINSVNTDETGTKVSMNVLGHDVELFINSAIRTFLFFKVMPIITQGETEFYKSLNHMMGIWADSNEYSVSRKNYHDMRLTFQNDFTLSNHCHEFNILSGYGQSNLGLVMGQVYYSVDISQLARTEFERSIIKYPVSEEVQPFHKVIHVDIGEVSTQPSREFLNYTKQTIQTLRNHFFKAYIQDVSAFNEDVIKENLGFDISGLSKILKKYPDYPSWKRILKNMNDSPESGPDHIPQINSDVFENRFKSLSIAQKNVFDFKYDHRNNLFYKIIFDTEKNDKNNLNLIFDDLMSGIYKEIIVLQDTDLESLISAHNKSTNQYHTSRLPIGLKRRIGHHFNEQITRVILTTVEGCSEIHKNFENIPISYMRDFIDPINLIKRLKKPTVSKIGQYFCVNDHKVYSSKDVINFMKEGKTCTWEVADIGRNSECYLYVTDDSKMESIQGRIKKSDILISKNSKSFNLVHKLNFKNTLQHFEQFDFKDNTNFDNLYCFVVNFQTYKNDKLYKSKKFINYSKHLRSKINDMVNDIIDSLIEFKIPAKNLNYGSTELDRFIKCFEQHPGIEFTLFYEAIALAKADKNILDLSVIDQRLTSKLISIIKDEISDDFGELEQALKNASKNFIDRVHTEQFNYNDSIKHRYPMLNFAHEVHDNNEANMIIEYVKLIEKELSK